MPRYAVEANVGEYDADVLRAKSEPDFERHEELIRLLDTPSGTQHHVVERAEILARHGFLRDSLGYLHANALVVGDTVYRAMREMFGYASDREFEEAVYSFFDEFHLLAKESRPAEHRGLLSYDFVAESSASCEGLDQITRRVLHPMCHVQIEWQSDGVTADAYNTSGLIGDDEAIVLRRCGGEWTVIETRGPNY